MKITLVCLLLIIGGFRVSAQQPTPLLELSLTGGYQAAGLQWSIAGNLAGQSPNVLSEVKWRGLAGSVVTGGLKLRLFRRFFLQGGLYHAAIKHGRATDSDYGQDDRAGRSYYAELNADEGYFRGGQLQLGYEVFSRRRLNVSVSAGYKKSQEELYLLDHQNAVPGERNLRSVYNTDWHGPVASVNLRYRLLERLTLNNQFSYGQLSYRATADWNLIDAFQHPISFRQKAQGYDLQNALSVNYQLKPFLAILLTATASRAETGSGVDDLYLESGAVQSTRFNGVSKNMQSIQLGLLFRL